MSPSFFISISNFCDELQPNKFLHVRKVATTSHKALTSQVNQVLVSSAFDLLCCQKRRLNYVNPQTKYLRGCCHVNDITSEITTYCTMKVYILRNVVYVTACVYCIYLFQINKNEYKSTLCKTLQLHKPGRNNTTIHFDCD